MIATCNISARHDLLVDDLGWRRNGPQVAPARKTIEDGSDEAGRSSPYEWDNHAILVH